MVGPLARDADRVRRARQGVAERRDDPARGRDRHRQGGVGRGDPPRQPAPRQAVPGRRLRRACRRNLLESELFGHERGAFTGAVVVASGRVRGGQRRHGVPRRDWRAAASTCSRSCCACSSGARSGASAPTTTSRSTCGSSPPPTASLREQVAAQKFRSDLYYRLAVVEVKLPPLRERLADLPLLVDHIVRNLGARRRGRRWRTVRVAASSSGALAHHSWPGNIRELRNYLERCVALHDFAPPRSAAGRRRPPGPRARSTSASRCARRARPG